ncbi:MAG TPA: MarR family transcriptional regulator [Thermaerobacter sp.]
MDRTHLIDAITRLASEAAERQALLGPGPWLELDLTMPQLKVLFVLGARGPTRPGVLAESVRTIPSNLTGILGRLEAHGLVERQPDPEDRRAAVVRLTPHGEQLLADLYAAGQELLAGLLAQVPTTDLEALHRGLTALVAVLRAPSPAPAAPEAAPPPEPGARSDRTPPGRPVL